LWWKHTRYDNVLGSWVTDIKYVLHLHMPQLAVLLRGRVRLEKLEVELLLVVNWERTSVYHVNQLLKVRFLNDDVVSVIVNGLRIIERVDVETLVATILRLHCMRFRRFQRDIWWMPYYTLLHMLLEGLNLINQSL
jgi:hypothetical protein